MKYNKGYVEDLDNQFSIHIADNAEEFQEILELEVIVHGEPVRGYFKAICLEHPNRDNVFLFYIKDKTSNQIVASIALLPLKWVFKDKTFPICEMGFVGTLEKYRGKGLFGKLNQLYEKVMDEKGYVVSVLRGIAYFYRKYGYEYAFALDERFTLSPNKIPSTQLSELKIRKAGINDIDFIAKKYKKFYNKYYVSNKFDKDSFLFRFLNEDFNDFKSTTYLIENNEQPIAYFIFSKTYDNIGYEFKHSKLDYNSRIKILQFTKSKHGNKNTETLDLAIRTNTDLANIVIELGGYLASAYGWQVKIPDLKLYFETLSSVLENRVKNSIFKGLTQNIKISNYKETIEMFFKDGKVSSIKSEKGYPDVMTCDVQIPGPLLYKFILGDKTIDEINYIIRDARVLFSSKKLLEVLFPKEVSYPESYY